MIKEIFVKISNDKETKTLNFWVDEKDEDLAIESLSHDLGEKGWYIDDVFYK